MTSEMAVEAVPAGRFSAGDFFADVDDQDLVGIVTTRDLLPSGGNDQRSVRQRDEQEGRRPEAVDERNGHHGDPPNPGSH